MFTGGTLLQKKVWSGTYLVGWEGLLSFHHILFTVSILANVAFLFVFKIQQIHTRETCVQVGTQDASLYAQLPRNENIRIMESTPFAVGDLTSIRKIWEDINIDIGMVALPDSLAAELDLPSAQRFPWDEQKGLYFLNGFHNLHCLRAVHISLMEFAHGEPQSRRFKHVLHCMEALRQDIICNADDTPRYTTADKTPESGVNQLRKCRSWEKLEAWAQQHNACYHFINQTATGFPNVLRYTFCPEDSPYIPRVKAVMGGVNLTDLQA